MPALCPPRAILLDLDDTILDNEGTIPACWRVVCADTAQRRPELDAERLNVAIKGVGEWFWSDPDRERAGRLAPRAAGVRIVQDALISLGFDDADLAGAIADAYRDRRRAAIRPFPGAIEALEQVSARGIRLALVTNGAGPTQRSRIERFDLARFFDHILIEGEFGVGKPDERVYNAALEALDARPSDTWMVGDNLEWEVAAPKRMGLGTVWVDRLGVGVRPGSLVTADHVIGTLGQLPSLLR